MMGEDKNELTPCSYSSWKKANGIMNNLSALGVARSYEFGIWASLVSRLDLHRPIDCQLKTS